MTSVPPDVEWKHVDRGKPKSRTLGYFVDRKTLMAVLRILVWIVQLVRLIHKLVDGV